MQHPARHHRCRPDRAGRRRPRRRARPARRRPRGRRRGRARPSASGRHVRLFSPWSELVDPAARRLLDAAGLGRSRRRRLPDRRRVARRLPRSRWPTSLAAARAGSSALPGPRGRRGPRRARPAGRLRPRGRPVRRARRGPAGRERLLAGAVVDASGTWSRPEPARRRRLPGPGRAGARRPHHLRHPRPRRPGRRRAVRRQARRGRRRGRLGAGRPGRSRPARRAGARAPGSRGCCGGPSVGRRLRWRRQRPARGSAASSARTRAAAVRRPRSPT